MSKRWSWLWVAAVALVAACQYVDPPGSSPGSSDCSDADCGPAPGAPNIECEDGSIGGPVCERDSDGECAWDVRECPGTDDACTEEECGPAPAAPNFLCDDGSIGGPGPCERNDAGVCGWTFRDCPP